MLKLQEKMSLIITTQFPNQNLLRNTPSSVRKTHKIYCKNCGADWGIQCVWSSSGYQYPVIKCSSFTFKIEESFMKVKKWSYAPFVIQPMEENLGSEDFS